MSHVSVYGGGPAGASAAIAARNCGAEVTIHERGTFPRHKVCGEFLSPEISALLQKLGLSQAFAALRPRQYNRLELHFGKHTARHRFSEPAFGLSRYAFDKLLFDHSRQLGADLVRDPAPSHSTWPVVIAHGRREELPRGRRLFGFKAHFEGPGDDTVSLYFADHCYIGVNTVEDGVTNVCGVAPESQLREFAFDFDAYTNCLPALRERMKPLTRTFDWLATGPLAFRQRWTAPAGDQYPAGDALSFIDPFTGSGLLSAVLTGILAGEHAANGIPVDQYLKRCRKSLRNPFLASSAMRAALDHRGAETLAALLPPRWLMQLTRPTL